MFGSPVPGITRFAGQCSPVNDAGARFGETFFTVLGEYYDQHPFEGAAPELPREAFQPYFDMFGDRFPLPVVSLFLASWTRLYGMVAMEVFGQLQWAVTDAGPLFELELSRTVGELAR
jgi:Tetracyclin repressor-like, C-terminal domain